MNPLFFYFINLFKYSLKSKDIPMHKIISTNNGCCGSFEFENKEYSIFICESQVVSKYLESEVVDQETH